VAAAGSPPDVELEREGMTTVTEGSTTTGAVETEGRVGALESAATVGATSTASDEGRRNELSGVEVFGVVVGAIAGAAAMLTLGALAWRRQLERKRRANVLRQVNMTQL